MLCGSSSEREMEWRKERLYTVDDLNTSHGGRSYTAARAEGVVQSDHLYSFVFVGTSVVTHRLGPELEL